MKVWIRKNILGKLIVKCIIGKQISNSFKIIKTVHVEATKKSFVVGKGEYTIDMTKTILTKKNDPILFYEHDKTYPICFGKNDSKRNAELLKSLLVEKTVKGILGNNPDMFLTIAVIGLIIGIVAISIFSLIQMQTLQETIMELTKKIPPPPIIIKS